MPRVAAPLDRARCEEALGPSLLASLGGVCHLLGVPPDRWHRVEAVARVFGTVAVARLATRVQEDEGVTELEALDLAALRLGVAPDTARTRLRRWLRESYGCS